MGKSIWRSSGLHLKDQVGTRPRLSFSPDSCLVTHTCLGHHNRVRLCGQIHYVDNLACPDLSFFICKMGLNPLLIELLQMVSEILNVEHLAYSLALVNV